MEGWIMPSQVGVWNGILGKGNVNANEQHTYALELDSTNAVLCIIGNGTAANLLKSTATPLRRINSLIWPAPGTAPPSNFMSMAC